MDFDLFQILMQIKKSGTDITKRDSTNIMTMNIAWTETNPINTRNVKRPFKS